MLAARVRSGLEETYHDGTVAVVSDDGALIAASGDLDRPFFLRSSAKPFQAFISQEAGAELEPLEMAVACASHRGFPVHIAMVEKILARGGLDESALQCPPGWPIGARAFREVLRAGAKMPKRIWHNCSGKHAGFLRACVARGWPIDTYLDPSHPLQVRVIEFVSEVGEHDVEPVGVDGCGAPVLRTTARAMALMFARLGSDPALRPVFTAMHRYPALVSSNGEGDSSIATAIHAASKGGAEGCVGIALKGGLGVAVKSWDGLGEIAGVGAVATLEAIDRLSPTAIDYLAPIARPAVRGGDRVVGSAEPRLELVFS